MLSVAWAAAATDEGYDGLRGVETLCTTILARLLNLPHHMHIINRSNAHLAASPFLSQPPRLERDVCTCSRRCQWHGRYGRRSDDRPLVSPCPSKGTRRASDGARTGGARAASNDGGCAEQPGRRILGRHPAILHGRGARAQSRPPSGAGVLAGLHRRRGAPPHLGQIHLQVERGRERETSSERERRVLTR